MTKPLKSIIISTAICSLFLFMIAGLHSCEPNRSELRDPAPTNSLLLKQFIVLDTTLSAPDDTIYKYKFYYDDLNRCTSITGTDGIDPFVIINYYNGNDTLMNRRILCSTGDTTSEFFVYSPDGKMLSDSVIESAAGLSRFFLDYHNTTSQGGTILINSNSNEFEYNNYTSTRDVNGNILHLKDSLYQISPNGYFLTSSSEANISYDDKINPFYKLVPNFISDVESECSNIFTFLPFLSLPQKNNILTETRIYSMISNINFNNACQYEYNSDNYPTIVRVNDVANSVTYKGLYLY